MHDVAPQTAARSRSQRNVLHWIHLCIGGLLSVPLFLIGLTGAILVFEHEIDAWLDPPPLAAAVGPAHPADDILAAAHAMVPRGAAPMFFVPARAAGAAAEVRFRSARGGFVRVFVDPASLEVLATHADGGLLRTLSQLHSNLLARELGGRQVVGWLGMAMLILGASGLVLWWPRGGRWRAAFCLERRARGAALLRELHRSAGFWGLAVFMVVSFSGVFLAFPQTVGDGIRTLLPGRDVRGFLGPAIAPAPGGQPLDLEAALALARAAAPGAELRSVGLPQRPDQPVRVSLAPPGTASGPVPQITVFVDPWQHRIVEQRDPRTYTTGETIVAWQRALHAGEGLGRLWRTLVFVAGLLPMFFTVTGVAMWALKRRRRRSIAAPLLSYEVAEK